MTLYGVGNVIIDLTVRVPRLPVPGGDVVASQADYVVGGSFNTMVAAARHGLPTSYAGAHGSGPFGDRARAALVAAGIAVLQRATPGRDTGFDIAITQADGERSFITVFGAEAELCGDQLLAVRPVAGDFVHLSGYGLLPATNGAVLAEWVARLAPEVTVLLDPGPLVAEIAPSVWEAVIPRVRWFSGNRSEAEALTGRTDPGQAARALTQTFDRVVVRDGDRGAWLAAGESCELVPSIAVPVVDTNGAGDAHCGALLAALARGGAPRPPPTPCGSPTCVPHSRWVATAQRPHLRWPRLWRLWAKRLTVGGTWASGGQCCRWSYHSAMTLAQSLLGFVALAAVVAVTPGLDTVLVLRQSLRSGRASAFAAAAGICVGALLWGIAAAAGVAALFVASPVAAGLLRWAGVAFLVYLAVSYLRSAWRGPVAVDTSDPAPDAPSRAFLKGLLTDLLNPKMAVFYLTVLPLFLPSGYPPALAGAMLAGVHAVVAMAWFVVVIVAAGSVRGFVESRRGARLVDGLAGVAMLGFGAVLGLER